MLLVMEHGDAVSQFERFVMGAVGLTTQALGRATPGEELTFPQWRAIVIVGESDRGARVGEIATRVGVTVPATSRLLQRLRRRGLITLEPDREDRRATRASLTDEGRVIRDAIFEFRRVAIIDAIRSFSATDLPTIVAALAILATSLDRWT